MVTNKSTTNTQQIITGLFTLTALSTLDVSTNLITVLQPAIVGLSSLQELIVSKNQLVIVPKEVGSLK